MRIMSVSEQLELESAHIRELRDAQNDFERWQKECNCSCVWVVNGLNAGTDYFQIETKLERFDPFCFKHGEPDCKCHWTIWRGDWYIEEYDEDCPIHKHEEIEEEKNKDEKTEEKRGNWCFGEEEYLVLIGEKDEFDEEM